MFHVRCVILNFTVQKFPIIVCIDIMLLLTTFDDCNKKKFNNNNKNKNKNKKRKTTQNENQKFGFKYGGFVYTTVCP